MRPLLGAHPGAQLIAGALLTLLAACSRVADEPAYPAPPAELAPAAHVGAAACADCHPKQAAAWRGSHHALAMQPADEQTVLGNFDDAIFTHRGVASRFFRRDGGYWVETDNGRGELQEYPVSYTFGVEPLQQYLIGTDGGRYQALSIAWDARPAAQGGERWFHLYPDETFGTDDPLHWTGALNNWNFMCAECHSTQLNKNYQAGEDRYQTVFSDINVACEACHGPGSRHVATAKQTASEMGLDSGLAVSFADSRAEWRFEDDTGIARRATPLTDTAILDACGACHARRGQFAEENPGQPLLESYRLALLEEGLYQADGQILDEVYVYGSFLQSKMHQAGVVCTDCHDPHTAELKGNGDAVCAQCHQPEVFSVRAHHHHEPDSEGARCVSCHMPARTYMVVDPRRDHSFRVPRPDLSATIGTDNPCSACHSDQSSQWAADRIRAWHPDGRSGSFHYGQALHGGRTWAADAPQQLQRVIEDGTQPAIVRATALSLLARQLDDRALSLAEGLLSDHDPLLRLAAVNALAGTPPELRVRLLRDRLTDDVRAVRMEAARALAGPAEAGLGERRQQQFQVALAEYRAAQNFNADRAEGVFNLATLAAQRGRAADAESLYLAVLGKQPDFLPALLNLADLYRGTGQDARAAATLAQALQTNPDSAALHHAHGLALVRLGRSDEGLAALRRAFELAPDQPRFAYVLGVAMFEQQPGEAIALLRQAHEAFPGRHDLLLALATMSRDVGEFAAARGFAEKLAAISPTNPAARELLSTLPR